MATINAANYNLAGMTSTGIVKYDGTTLVSSTTAKIDSSNAFSNTSQPSFSAYLQTTTGSVTGDGTQFTVLFDTKIYDQTTSYNTGTGIFTAPTTGRYLFGAKIGYAKGTTVATLVLMRLVTTAATYFLYTVATTANTLADDTIEGVLAVSMTAGDTAKITFQISGTIKNTVIGGNDNSYPTQFWGTLLC